MASINYLTNAHVEEYKSNPTMNNYQEISRRSAIYPGQNTSIGLMYATLKLNGEAGETAEHVGKAMRDDGYGQQDILMTNERKAAIVKELGDVLWYLAACAEEIGETLDYVAEENLRKLVDRTERDTLRGSGDER